MRICMHIARHLCKKRGIDEQMQEDKKGKPWEERPSSVSPCARQGGQVGPSGGKWVEETGKRGSS